MHVVAWVEEHGRAGLSAPSAKQRLAAVRMLFDWLAIGQAVTNKPAATVRGPNHSTARGKTREEAMQLLAATPPTVS